MVKSKFGQVKLPDGSELANKVRALKTARKAALKPKFELPQSRSTALKPNPDIQTPTLFLGLNFASVLSCTEAVVRDIAAQQDGNFKIRRLDCKVQLWQVVCGKDSQLDQHIK